MLTLNRAGVVCDAKSAACFVAAAALSAITLFAICSPARADQVAVGGCLGGRVTINCAARWGDVGDPYVRIVPPPAGDEERAHAAERERQWEQRCKPVVAQDRFGVARYLYAAPGCEFGVLN